MSIETIEDKSPRDIISKARFQMLERYPFFGDIAMNLSVIKDPAGIVNAPIAVTRNGYLVYHPDEIKEYIEDFGLEGLITMTAHEILHKILKHFEERDSLKETVEDRYNVTVARESPLEEILFGIQDAKDNQLLLEDRVLDLQVIRDSGVTPSSIASKLKTISREFDYTYIKDHPAGKIFLDVVEKLPKGGGGGGGGGRKRKQKKQKKQKKGPGKGGGGKKQKQKKKKKQGKKGKKKKEGKKKGGHKKARKKVQPVWARKREKEQDEDQGQGKDREQGQDRPEIVRMADEIQKERQDPHNIPEIEEELAEEKKGKEGKEKKQQSKFDPDRNFDWEQVKNKAKQYARSKGDLPGGLSRLIEEMERRPQLDWRTILQQWTRKILQSDYTWRRPADSYHSTGVYLPSVKQENVKIGFAVDTSGSVRPNELSAFVAEGKNILRSRDNVEIYMIACDAAVHDTAWIQNPQLISDMDFAGGGGTDFRPVFRHIRDEQIQIDGLVYLTDARGNFPEKKPQYPVLWLIRGVERIEDLPDRWTPPFGRKIVFNE